MKILLLNLYFPPDASATAKMAKTVVDALCKEHEVTIVCGRPSYEPTERRAWRLWQTETSGRTRIVRVGSTAFPRFNMKKRVINYLSYVLFAVPRALFVRCDAVLAMTDPPFEGIVGAFVAMLKGKPYIYNIRDMYPDMAVGGGLMPKNPVTWFWESVHRWALRRAAKIIVLGEDMRQRILAKGLRADQLEIVCDGVELSDSPAPLDPEVVAQIRGSFRFVLVHAGNLGFYGAWDALLDVAGQLVVDRPDIGLVFIGEGAEKARLQNAAKDLANVRFLPFFPASKIPSVLAAADAHVVTLKHGLEGVVVPSKMYGILAAGKPLLGLVPEFSEADNLVRAGQCGYTNCPYDGVDEFAEFVRELSNDPQRVEKMGAAAKEAARGYDRVKEMEKFVRIATGVAMKGKKLKRMEKA